SGNPALRQSPEPATSAYSNVWLQCCQAKLLPSGVARLSPSIHTPHGQLLHERISEIISVPSGDTRLPGVPRLSSATDRPPSSSAALPWPAPSRASITASPTSAARPAIAAGRSPPATTSTGRSVTPRRSLPGAKASCLLLDAGTHS